MNIIGDIFPSDFNLTVLDCDTVIPFVRCFFGDLNSMSSVVQKYTSFISDLYFSCFNQNFVVDDDSVEFKFLNNSDFLF